LPGLFGCPCLLVLRGSGLSGGWDASRHVDQNDEFNHKKIKPLHTTMSRWCWVGGVAALGCAVVVTIMLAPGVYVARDVDTSSRILRSPTKERIGVFIAYGQSNSECCGEMGYSASDNVFQHWAGCTYSYGEPMLGSLCGVGCVWGRVADMLIPTVYDEVVTMTCGVGGYTIAQLAGHGAWKIDAIGCLTRGIVDLNRTFGHVDGIFFHQGESNNRYETSTYRMHFDSIIERLGPFHPTIYMAVGATVCNNQPDKLLTSIQLDIATDHVKGPFTDSLGSEFRQPDRCHFSSDGFDRMAEGFATAVIHSKI